MVHKILVSKHGKSLGLDRDGKLIAAKGLVSGGQDESGVVMPSNNTVALFDDFLGDLIADEWAVVKGDTGAVSTMVLTTATNGVLRLSMEPTPLNVSGENLALTGGLFLNWKANQGPAGEYGSLRLSARVKFESVSRTAQRQHVFVGFSDTGGAEMPAYDTGGGVISNAADLVGFLFSPGGDTGWSLVGVKSTAGDSGDLLTVPNPVASPSANVYENLEVEVRRGAGQTGGRASFFRNGKLIGAINSPVAPTVALTPWLGFWVQDTGARYMDIDYVHISAPRDTGF